MKDGDREFIESILAFLWIGLASYLGVRVGQLISLLLYGTSNVI